jgi:hypothetical protein
MLFTEEERVVFYDFFKRALKSRMFLSFRVENMDYEKERAVLSDLFDIKVSYVANGFATVVLHAK